VDRVVRERERSIKICKFNKLLAISIKKDEPKKNLQDQTTLNRRLSGFVTAAAATAFFPPFFNK
jgi:hypothetical protein